MSVADSLEATDWQSALTLELCDFLKKHFTVNDPGTIKMNRVVTLRAMLCDAQGWPADHRRLRRSLPVAGWGVMFASCLSGLAAER